MNHPLTRRCQELRRFVNRFVKKIKKRGCEIWCWKTVPFLLPTLPMVSVWVPLSGTCFGPVFWCVAFKVFRHPSHVFVDLSTYRWGMFVKESRGAPPHTVTSRRSVCLAKCGYLVAGAEKIFEKDKRASFLAGYRMFIESLCPHSIGRKYFVLGGFAKP